MLFKNVFVKVLCLFAVVSLVGCQGTSTSSSKYKTSGQTLKVNSQTVPVIKSKDGVQDIPWTMSRIKFKKALFFSDMPKFTLQSRHQRIIGNTGCNTIYGTYNIDVAQQRLKFQVNAGHQSCNGALAQEAELMDALSRVEYFSLQAKTLSMYDASRQMLIQAEIR